MTAAINFELSAAPGLLDFPFYNYGSSDIAVGAAVAIDSTNAISATNSTKEGIGIKLPAADGDPVIGYLMETAKAGKPARVRCGGIAKGFASGTVTAGTYVMSTTTGATKTAGTAKAGSGIALTTAADTEPVLVLVLAGALNA